MITKRNLEANHTNLLLLLIGRFCTLSSDFPIVVEGNAVLPLAKDASDQTAEDEDEEDVDADDAATECVVSLVVPTEDAE